ncbi:Gibberellin 20-oxidase-like protein [Linum grandiflorum]
MEIGEGSSSSTSRVQLPVVDISEPLNLSSLSSLADACQKWGFFHIINHGIPKHLYDRIYSLSQHFFSFPCHSKLEQLGPPSLLQTYTPNFIASPFFESLRVSGPDFFSSAHSSASPLLTPHLSSEFSELIEEYGSKMTELSKRITAILLTILGKGFDEKFHESEFGRCHGYLRVINYTVPAEADNVKKDDTEVLVEGLGMHTDMSCVTIVYQDQIGGLQVKSESGDGTKWMDITPSEETLVVNIGDMLQAWSNDKFRSSEHRVMLCGRGRLSLAFFWCFEDEKVIWAPEEVVSLSLGRRAYRSFVCSEYLRFREIKSERGRFEKVGYTVRDFASVDLPNRAPTDS